MTAKAITVFLWYSASLVQCFSEALKERDLLSFYHIRFSRWKLSFNQGTDTSSPKRLTKRFT